MQHNIWCWNSILYNIKCTWLILKPSPFCMPEIEAPNCCCYVKPLPPSYCIRIRKLSRQIVCVCVRGLQSPRFGHSFRLSEIPRGGSLSSISLAACCHSAHSLTRFISLLHTYVHTDSRDCLFYSHSPRPHPQLQCSWKCVPHFKSLLSLSLSLSS